MSEYAAESSAKGPLNFNILTYEKEGIQFIGIGNSDLTFRLGGQDLIMDYMPGGEIDAEELSKEQLKKNAIIFLGAFYEFIQHYKNNNSLSKYLKISGVTNERMAEFLSRNFKSTVKLNKIRLGNHEKIAFIINLQDVIDSNEIIQHLHNANQSALINNYYVEK